MPQMAPIMWMPLFILIISLLLLTKLTIYFISNKKKNQALSNKNYFNNNWSW